ncbi:5764_t:CDS:2, partial [Funneliformis caledonium]
IREINDSFRDVYDFRKVSSTGTRVWKIGFGKCIFRKSNVQRLATR